MKKLLVRMKLDFGRLGELSSVFVCTDEQLESLNGKFHEFGEVLGKHSEVSCTFDAEDFTILTEDQSFIEDFERIVGDTGNSPLR